MKKQISVDDLRMCMFVCGFGAADNAPHTMPAQFAIGSEAEIARLRKFFSHVWIDTELGPDVDAPDTTQDAAQSTSPAHTERGVPSSDALRNARRLHRRARSVVDNLLTDIRFGRALELGDAREVVQETINSMLKNPNALLYLAQLKSADTSLAQRAVNTAILSIAFAKCISIAKVELPNLGLGALLYDLGMITVPGTIRNKPGRLDGDEFQVVKAHVEASIELLGKVDGMSATVLDIVESHHERVDGTGYPRGLKGKQISLLGRMLAIVSVYFTLTSTRPYAQPVSMKDALAILYDQCDKAYDGRLVHKFIRCVGIYPPGCAVELVSGEIGLIVAASPDSGLQPVMRVYVDARKRRVETPYLLDLATAGNAMEVSRVLKPREYDVLDGEHGAVDRFVLRGS